MTTYYEKMRIILLNNDQSTNETVVFTEDFNVSAADYCSRDQRIISDSIIEGFELPDSFPLDYELNRS